MKLFDQSPAYREQPGQPGYPRWTMDVVSPELPCGAGWLATAFMTLGIPVFKPWGIFDTDSWQPLGNGKFRYHFEGSGWSRLLPDLVDGREFSFLREPVPRFSHLRPEAFVPAASTILVVRDPRDAIASGAARARRTGNAAAASAADFARAPWSPGLASWRDYLHGFLTAWLDEARRRRVRVVRFEDAKQAPEQTLAGVLDWIGFPASPAALREACRAAAHGRLKQRDLALVAAGTVPTPILGDGVPYAWKRAPDEALAQALGARFNALCGALGYQPMV